MVLYRPHRCYLEDSMKEVKEFNSLRELRTYLTEENLIDFTDETLEVTKYGIGVDERNGWDTFIVTSKGNVVGFTNGPLR